MTVGLGASTRPRLALRFFLVALILHAALLLLPVPTPDALRPESGRLKVRLKTSQVPVRAAELLSENKQSEPHPDPTDPVPKPRTADTAPVSPTADPVEVPPARPLPTPQQLRRAAARGRWQKPSSSEYVIERSTESVDLERLRRPVLARKPNVFDRYIAPTRTEIVDRWLEPGGVHRVVVHTSAGETLCGRQEPVDDFRPWLQMPMMFHRCAGGGARSGATP